MAARRRTRKTPRRRNKTMINVLNLTESYILASAATQALFGTTAANFALEGWALPKTAGASQGAGNSWTLSASELISSAFGDNSHMSSQWQGMGGVGAAMRHNLKNNGAKALGTMIAVPIMFRVGKKLAGKPIRATNRLLKVGTGGAVKL
jgi:hypothetical protein